MGGWTSVPRDVFGSGKIVENVCFQSGARAARAALSGASSTYENMTDWISSEWERHRQPRMPVLIHSTNPAFPGEGSFVDYTLALLDRMSARKRIG